MSKYRLYLIFSLLVAPLAAGCHRRSIGDGATPKPGEVWLTPKQAEEAKIVVAPLDEQIVDDTILASGRVTFDDSRVGRVFSPVSGRVSRIDVQLGARVKKGDPIAVIESPELGLASSDVGKAQADLIAASHDVDRQRELLAAKAASQRDFEQAEDAFRKAKAELERAKQKARLLRAGDGVSQTYIARAPIDGDVISKNITLGMEVQGQYSGGAATELFTIGEMDQVWVVADVFEMDIARIRLGSKALVKVIAYPDRIFEGKVDWISGTLDPQTRTARVRCNFDNKDHALKPEMFATVQLSVEERKALAIPRTALVRIGSQTVVFVHNGKTDDGKLRFERLPVIVDEGEGSPWIPISHGPQKGTEIVISSAILLSSLL